MSRTAYVLFCGLCISVLKEVNHVVDEPYMDEPFHVPQAKAYCAGDFYTWDPKLTTPPGLYILSLIIHRVFVMKCTLPILRVTSLLSLLAMPIAVTRLLCFYKRVRPPLLFAPDVQAIIISMFPIAWFFGFLYYTDVPSVVFVLATVASAGAHKHWLAATFGLLSCTFRQTNVIWVLYAYASSQLMYLRFRKAPNSLRLHDPPALESKIGDLLRAIISLPNILGDIIVDFIPYLLVLAAFATFVVWNGGIVLGDKSNHIPALHVPQLYYFMAFTAAFGWPVLLSYRGGPRRLIGDVFWRICSTKTRAAVSIALLASMCVTVKFFTIHHPFLLSDNRHYTFYAWKRVYLFHWTVPYLLTPIYMVCAWAWFLRVGQDQSLLQTILLPILSAFTLLPTPLLEPRYFLIPYVLLRGQVANIDTPFVVLEALWYMTINLATMGVFLYMPRESVGRFMW